MKPCVTCGKETQYRCPFCLTYGAVDVPLCGEVECRENHEVSEAGCVRTRREQGGPQHG